MSIDFMHHLLLWAFDPVSWSDFSQSLLHSLGHWQSTIDWDTVGQARAFDTDVFAGTRRIFDNFIRTGQVWAFLMGLILGYIVKSLTSYG